MRRRVWHHPVRATCTCPSFKPRCHSSKHRSPSLRTPVNLSTRTPRSSNVPDPCAASPSATWGSWKETSTRERRSSNWRCRKMNSPKCLRFGSREGGTVFPPCAGHAVLLGLKTARSHLLPRAGSVIFWLLGFGCVGLDEPSACGWKFFFFAALVPLLTHTTVNSDYHRFSTKRNIWSNNCIKLFFKNKSALKKRKLKEVYFTGIGLYDLSSNNLLRISFRRFLCLA